MLGHIKKESIKKGILCGIFFLWVLSMVFSLRIQAQPLICPEGEYVLLFRPDSDHDIDVYNCRGEYCSEYHDYRSPHGRIYPYQGKIIYHFHDSSIVCLETGEVLRENIEHYYVHIGKAFYFVEEEETDRVDVYDAYGNFVITVPDYCGNSWDLEDRMVILSEGETGTDAYVLSYGNGQLAVIRKEWFSEVSFSEFTEPVRFGNYYVLNSPKQEKVIILSKELEYIGLCHGMLKYEGLDDDYYVTIPDDFLTDSYFIIKTEKRGNRNYYHFIGTDLAEHFVVYGDDWDEWMENKTCSAAPKECYKNYVAGGKSPALMGLPVAGYTDAGWERYPYAVTDDRLYIYYHGSILSLDCSVIDAPTAVNSEYVAQGVSLYRLDSLEKVTFPEFDEIYAVWLKENSIVIHGNDQKYGKIYALYDNELHKLLHVREDQGEGESGVIASWYGESWYCRNRFMEGMIDEEGNWIMKRWNAEE